MSGMNAPTGDGRRWSGVHAGVGGSAGRAPSSPERAWKGLGMERLLRCMPWDSGSRRSLVPAALTAVLPTIPLQMECASDLKGEVCKGEKELENSHTKLGED